VQRRKKSISIILAYLPKQSKNLAPFGKVRWCGGCDIRIEFGAVEEFLKLSKIHFLRIIESAMLASMNTHILRVRPSTYLAFSKNAFLPI
jgi:hypothetical protein